MSFLSTIIVIFATNQVVNGAPVLNLNGLANGFDLSSLKLGNITPGPILPSNTIGTNPGGVLIPVPNAIPNPIVLPASNGFDLGGLSGNLEPVSTPQQGNVAVANLNYLGSIN
ncbi:hypothetical protein BJ165DRAFT_1409606 [Panaeolus papilionaceus]|nr:hypothetical protein BJ165DRAFT_1409606 [Panaeolus papilionaceus]